MKRSIFNVIWNEALDDNNKAAFIADWLTSSIWNDDPTLSVDQEKLNSRVNQISRIWTLAHMTVADIRHTTELSQGRFAERFCIPRNTVINWEQRGGCADYIRLMLAQLCGLTEGLFNNNILFTSEDVDGCIQKCPLSLEEDGITLYVYLSKDMNHLEPEGEKERRFDVFCPLDLMRINVDDDTWNSNEPADVEFVELNVTEGFLTMENGNYHSLCQMLAQKINNYIESKG